MSFMENKTFCSNCRVHCYKPEMREKIREVMRFSGPRMLLCHPILAVWHVVCRRGGKEKAEEGRKHMIKKRLVGLLSHAKKYIVYQVLWQWFSLLCQILMIYSASMLLGTGAFCRGDSQDRDFYGALVLAAMALRFV